MLTDSASPGHPLVLSLAVVERRRKPSSSERLAAAIVSQAVNDVTLYHGTRYPLGRRIYRDAWRWIFSDDRVNPFAFINLCEAIGLSPGKIRAGVNRILKRIDAESARRTAA